MRDMRDTCKALTVRCRLLQGLRFTCSMAPQVCRAALDFANHVDKGDEGGAPCCLPTHAAEDHSLPAEAAAFASETLASVDSSIDKMRERALAAVTAAVKPRPAHPGMAPIALPRAVPAGAAAAAAAAIKQGRFASIMGAQPSPGAAEAPAAAAPAGGAPAQEPAPPLQAHAAGAPQLGPGALRPDAQQPDMYPASVAPGAQHAPAATAAPAPPAVGGTLPNANAIATALLAQFGHVPASNAAAMVQHANAHTLAGTPAANAPAALAQGTAAQGPRPGTQPALPHMGAAAHVAQPLGGMPPVPPAGAAATSAAPQAAAHAGVPAPQAVPANAPGTSQAGLSAGVLKTLGQTHKP
jgi:hypothetical protein